MHFLMYMPEVESSIIRKGLYMFQIVRTDRVEGPVMVQKSMQCDEACVEYLTFPSLEKTGMVAHLFTTRTGGVSKGIFATMNLSLSRGDSESDVLENYRRIGNVLGCDVEDMVASHQTHTTNIRRVTAEDKGKGVVVPRDYDDIDGLITDEKGMALVTYYADCVPLYFVDTEHQAIGLAHSGWKGTVGQMGACMVKAMQEQFGTKPEKLIAAIGPSICQECYEVSEDVAETFEELLNREEAREVLKEIEESGCYAHKGTKHRHVIVPGKERGKYQLDLWLANLVILRCAGIPLNQIEVTDICTCHNPDYLFSHRASEGKRGNLAAFLMLKETTY